MKRKFYLVAAALMVMTATNVHAQSAVFFEDTIIDTAFDESDYAGETEVIVAGATLTFTHEALNVCGLPNGDGSTITLADGAKLVFHDSPDSWYAHPEDKENWDFADYLTNSNSEIITAIPFNFVIDGDATIVCDSKSYFGGTIGGAGDLTMVVGDSTVLNMNLQHFTGNLILQYCDEAENETVLFGSIYPGTSACGESWNNPSAKCWCTIPWTLEVPDGVLLREVEGKIGNSHISFPIIKGQCSLYGPATITLRPAIDWVYDFVEVTGGADNRNFEIYSAGNATISSAVDYICAYVYMRNKNTGLWINSQEPCFVNCANAISVRNNTSFIGGNGIIACDVDCKDGIDTHISPGATYGAIGDLRVNRDVYLNNNNGLDIDFGSNGASDRLVVDGKCKIAGANTRLWINLTEEFYVSPKVGDYKVIDAAEFIPNTVYVTDTTFTDIPVYSEEQLDSIMEINPDADREYWAGIMEIEKVDTIDAIVSQNLVVMANTFEDGTRCDSLPEGYEWNFDNFFVNGIISIIGEGYVPGEIVNGPTSIEKPIATDPNKNLVETRIFTIEGREVNYPVKGINILRMRYEDGTVETKKILRTED